jgi:hypothetical protein
MEDQLAHVLKRINGDVDTSHPSGSSRNKPARIDIVRGTSRHVLDAVPVEANG